MAPRVEVVEIAHNRRCPAYLGILTSIRSAGVLIEPCLCGAGQEALARVDAIRAAGREYSVHVLLHPGDRAPHN